MNSPIRKARDLFYGWVIVGAFLLIGATIVGMGGINAGQFINPISEELGIGQTWFGWAQSARLLAFAVASWLVGRALDRYGARVPLAVAGVCAGFALIGMSQISQGWHIVVLYLLLGMTGLQGAGGNLYGSVTISRWFLRRRGRALSIAFLGTPTGIFIFAPFTQFLIDNVGWRSAWLILGIGGAALVASLALLVVRRDPATMGLLPDGDPPDLPAAEGEPSPPPRRVEHSWTRAEAIRTSTFRRLAAVDGLRMVAVATLGVFRIPYYIDQGASPSAVAFALSAEAVASVLIAIPAGWLLDRFPPRYISATATLLMIGAFVATIAADSAPKVFLATIMYGLGAASFSVSQQAIWPHYFGSQFVGQIRGVALMVGITASAIGAPAAGWVHDSTGTFLPAWIVAIGALALAALVVATLPNPVREDSTATGDPPSDGSGAMVQVA